MKKKKSEETQKTETKKTQSQAKSNDLASQKPKESEAIKAEDLKSEGTEEAPEPAKKINDIDVTAEQEDAGSDQPEGSIEDLVVSEKEKNELQEKSEDLKSYGVTDESQEQFKNAEQDSLQKIKDDQDADLNAGIPIVERQPLSFENSTNGKSWLETVNTSGDLKSIQDEEESFDHLEEDENTPVDYLKDDEDHNEFDEKESEAVIIPESSEYKVPLPANERAHVDAVLKSVNENTAILRKKVILYQEFVAELPDSNEKEALEKKLSELHQ